jgi:hypothetical protein
LKNEKNEKMGGLLQSRNQKGLPQAENELKKVKKGGEGQENEKTLSLWLVLIFVLGPAVTIAVIVGCSATAQLLMFAKRGMVLRDPK